MRLHNMCMCNSPVCVERRQNEIQRMKFTEVFRDLDMTAYFLLVAENVKEVKNNVEQ